MSLQGLMSGADCAVAANPLSQVLKHADTDRSVQQDRMAGPSSSRLRHLPSSNISTPAEQDLAMARQFFEGNTQGAAVPPPMSMVHQVPRFDMNRSMSPMTQPGASLNDAWKEMQQNNVFQGVPGNSSQPVAWAGEFQPTQLVRPRPVETQANGSQSSLVGPSFRSAYGMPQYSAGMPYRQDPYMSGLTDNFANVNLSDKGKGKMRDSDLEAAFAQFDSVSSARTQQGSVQQEDHEAAQTRDALNQDESVKDSFLDSNSTFKEIWDQMRNSDLPPDDSDMAKWEAEFNQLMSGKRADGEVDYDYGSGLQSAWDNGFGGLGDSTGPESLKFDHEGIPILEPYTFEQNNRHLDPSASTQSPLADAKALLAQNGSLSEAALLLEAAIQKGDLGEGGYEAWILLGETRNMDEREELGMKALTEGVRLAEAAGNPGPGMVVRRVASLANASSAESWLDAKSLAISYTNEAFDRASNTMLMRWLRTRFPNHPVPQETLDALGKSSWHAHELVTDTFIGVAREQHAQGIVDPDVQVALGVLFYTNGSYDRAKDCFETALSVKPNDYLLWNRLGSALSNGNKPEESLGAYRQALNLRPTYTRAIYNVGVACMNIGADKEAAEHFLSALALQESTGGEKSEQLWLTLRRAFNSMDRRDLAELTKANPPLEAFRKEGFEF
ncbi:hypothetical protein EWM64_g10321 [Hericium alpestre]|uniref:Uncharacterized protein n=1 Tax=Hericium alpestre TaxID=135208 RepID=A0A4Y9ZIM7_9AGAM|nr:hypothetical protein EWM64_g10321 [Hericium alpestre]